MAYAYIYCSGTIRKSIYTKLETVFSTLDLSSHHGNLSQCAPPHPKLFQNHFLQESASIIRKSITLFDLFLCDANKSCQALKQETVVVFNTENSTSTTPVTLS